MRLPDGGRLSEPTRRHDHWLPHPCRVARVPERLRLTRAPAARVAWGGRPPLRVSTRSPLHEPHFAKTLNCCRDQGVITLATSAGAWTGRTGLSAAHGDLPGPQSPANPVEKPRSARCGSGDPAPGTDRAFGARASPGTARACVGRAPATPAAGSSYVHVPPCEGERRAMGVKRKAGEQQIQGGR